MSEFYGWVDDPRGVEAVMETLPFPVIGDLDLPIWGTGEGKTVLLHKVVEKLGVEFPIRKQTIGDCVSMGAAYAVDCIKAVDIVLHGQHERWVAETATEDIYAGSRNVIGKGRLGNSDGSLGVWAAKWMNEYGAIPRGKYGNIDLEVYSGRRAKSWGNSSSGQPNRELTDLVSKYPIQTISQVKTYEEARDLLANGHAITIASMQGFSSRRDSEGFAKPQGEWAHQMCLIAVDDAYRRPGCLCQNSWGPNWIAGPKRHDQPEGSFWIDADELERRILRTGDCWAISGYEGFKKQNLDWGYM